MATQKKRESFSIMTPPFILSYPQLDVPKKYKDPKTGQEGQEKLYNMEMIFADSDLEQFWLAVDTAEGFEIRDIKKLYVELAQREWPGVDVKATAVMKRPGQGQILWPVEGGAKRATAAEEAGKKFEHYVGCSIIKAKAKSVIKDTPSAPRLFYRDESGELKQAHRGTEVGDKIIAAKFYPGAICRSEINVVANEMDGARFLTHYINGVTFLKDGDRLGSGSMTERFEGIHGGQAAYDPTAGMDGGPADLDDEIPF